ncbi:MAG: SDR family NAD(P)-dependent oxidoreductase [Pseudomonadota bacterium]
MSKTILITGSSDGIGLEAAKLLANGGHRVILHGRSAAKLARAKEEHQALADCEMVAADLSDFDETARMAEEIERRFGTLDVLINNAGVFAVTKSETPSGLDIRFVVNTLAPYLLTRLLLPILAKDGRVLNLSSAAQSALSERALLGQEKLGDGAAYAQSKLAITMWSRLLALSLPDGPIIIAVNPGSLLATKMVREAYGMAGKDVGQGARILTELATAPEHAEAGGLYFDNDSGRFAAPHPDALDPRRGARLIELMDEILSDQLKGTT